MLRSCPQRIRHQPFPRPFRHAGLAVIFKDSLSTCLIVSTTFTFDHFSYELAQVSLTLQLKALHFFCLYCSLPSHKNKLTESMFPDQFSHLLDHCKSLPGDLCVLGDPNAHFYLLHNHITTKPLDLLRMFNLHQTVKQPTHRQGHSID